MEEKLILGVEPLMLGDEAFYSGPGKSIPGGEMSYFALDMLISRRNMLISGRDMLMSRRNMLMSGRDMLISRRNMLISRLSAEGSRPKIR